MARSSRDELSRRERQIMDAIYRHGSASVADVREEIADPPSYSTVRALLGVLTDKGHLTYSTDGPRYVYRPTTPREEASPDKRADPSGLAAWRRMLRRPRDSGPSSFDLLKAPTIDESKACSASVASPPSTSGH